MKVLVTGGAGHIGKATTERLLQQGWDVRVIGLEPEANLPGAEFVNCDIMNFDDLRRKMRGCHAVVHLAAIRGPQLATGHKIFEVNVAGTFNVFEAAALEGIRRIVHASSINALGISYYSLVDISPEYFPIDEEHPLFTSDPYSFSKELVENIGNYYWRREGISSLALRFPAVYLHDNLESEAFRRRREHGRQFLDEVAALPETERLARLATVKQSVSEFRKSRPLEFNGAIPDIQKRLHDEGQLWATYTFERSNFWSLLDERDAAQSIEKGLSARFDGAHALFITDDHNSLDYDSKTIVRLFFPEIPETKIVLSGSESLISIKKACALIGFAPEYSSRNLT